MESHFAHGPTVFSDDQLTRRIERYLFQRFASIDPSQSAFNATAIELRSPEKSTHFYHQATLLEHVPARGRRCKDR